MAYDVGDVIDNHYRVERRFDGGMGHVYIVLDQIVNKRFAIKQLPESHAAEPVLRERFRREAAAWLQLDYHPHIVQAHTYHERLDGPVLILEFVDGPSLDDLIRKDGPLSPIQLIAYSRQVCQALQYAATKEIPGRGQGVLHRDIKPSNVLISRANQLKVTDFGLAKIGGDAKITREGQYVGTITYSSPEQLRAAGNVTQLSDLYSWGAVMYQAVCGDLPFRGKTAADLYFAIQSQVPPSLEERCPDLNAALARCIHRCLEKEASARFESFKDLDQTLAALESVVAIRPDRRCAQCGYTTRRGGAKCMVCGATSALSPATPAPGRRSIGIWSCSCGARLRETVPRCPKCGRARTQPARDSSDETENPERTLRPQLRGATVGLTDSAPGATPPPGLAWSVDDTHAYLIELRGGGEVKSWLLDRSGYTLGRDPKMKIRLDDPTIARYHLFLVNLPVGWVAICPQGKTIARYNGWEARQRVLLRGDVLNIGKSWLAFSGPDGQSELPRIPGHWTDSASAKTMVRSRSGELTELLTNPPAACTIELPGEPPVTSHGLPLRIGSAPICDIRVTGSGVAPVHAVLTWQSNGVHLLNVVVDLETKVNDQPVLESTLGDGDRVMVGCVPMRIRLAGDLGGPARFRGQMTQSEPRRLGVTILTGSQRGQTAVLNSGETYVLGRVSENQLTITHDPHVSRRHLEVVVEGDVLRVRDLGSRGGFFVNQVHFKEACDAKLGDVLVVGRTSLLIHQELERDPW